MPTNIIATWEVYGGNTATTNSYWGSGGLEWSVNSNGLSWTSNEGLFTFNPSNSTPGQYIVTAYALGWTQCCDVATVRVFRTEVTDILDWHSNSVLATTLDVKTNASWAHPVTVKYRILGVPTAVNVNDGRVWIDCDSANEAHQFLYGTDTLVRTLGDLTDYESEAPTALGTNQFEVKWDGRDDRTNRLLLGGTFRVSASFTLAGYGDLLCRSSNVLQQIAQPHAGHFCGDWPRSSVYSNTPYPAGGGLTFYGNSANGDEDPSDNIHPTLKAAYEDPEDGGWSRMTMKFEWQDGLFDSARPRWAVYTPTNLTPGLASGVSGGAIPQENTNVLFDISDIRFRDDYPQARQAYIARYNGTDYDIYRTTNFWSTNYVATGVQMLNEGEWVSYDGSSDWDVHLELYKKGSPEVNSEVAVLLFPFDLYAANGVYNMGGGYSNGLPENIVQLSLTNFADLVDGDNFALEVFRGYKWRQLWGLEEGGESYGTDADGAATAANGYDSISYTSPQSTNDYGNLSAGEAIQLWTNSLALVEFSAHCNKGIIGWYRRVYEPGDDTNSVDELYDPAHHETIWATNVAAMHLDDVNVAILLGCNTADTNDAGVSTVGAFAEAGADIVMGFHNVQFHPADLFVHHFLTRAFQQSSNAVSSGLGIDVSWTNYPKVWEARDAACVDLFKSLSDDTNTTMYVYMNCVIDGYHGTNTVLNMKVYPPRYGAKDKED